MKDFLFNLLFPKICLSCGREEDYLYQDCKATLEILGIHQRYKTDYLSDLYFAINYQKPIIKKMLQCFKYEPLIKDLTKPISSLILSHFQLLDNKPNFTDFILIPVPLEKKRLKWRGFNQAEEIAKELSSFLNIPLMSNCLIKAKETLPQAELADEARRESVKGVFLVKNSEKIKNRKILLVDDVYTTGSTMEGVARILKEAGGKEIIGLVFAQAKPEDDFLQNI